MSDEVRKPSVVRILFHGAILGVVMWVVYLVVAAIRAS